MLTVHLIRHAESEGNVRPHIIGGQSNHLKLTSRGELQAEKLGERLAREGWSFEQVHSSTAVRTQATAAGVSKHFPLSLAEIKLTPLILELSHGEWEGQARAEKFTTEIREQMHAQPLDYASPGGESQRQVRDRMYAWLKSVSHHWDGESNLRVAAFSHGFAIRSLIGHLLQADGNVARQLVTHNTSITTVRFFNGIWLVERVNDFAHLEGTGFVDHY